jgi:hypothetical protein
MKEILMHICRYEDKNTAGKVAMLAWVLWNNRNNCIWNNEREAGQQLGVSKHYAYGLNGTLLTSCEDLSGSLQNSNNSSRRTGHDLRTIGISVMLTRDFTMKLVRQVLVRLGYKDNFQSLKVKQ